MGTKAPFVTRKVSRKLGEYLLWIVPECIAYSMELKYVKAPFPLLDSGDERVLSSKALSQLALGELGAFAHLDQLFSEAVVGHCVR